MKGNAPSETRGADTIYEFIDTINSWLVASPLKSNFLARPGFSLIDGKLTPWNCSVAPTSRREYRLPGNCREGCEQSCPPADRTESIFRQKLSRLDTMTGATLPRTHPLLPDPRLKLMGDASGGENIIEEAFVSNRA